MYGEDGPVVDIEEIVRVVSDAEVVIIGLAATPMRLLADLRGDDATPPILELVEPLANPQERAVWLAGRRPSLGPPDNSVFIPWPHSAGLLERVGVLSRIRERAMNDHGIDLSDDIESVLSLLREHERHLTQDAIRGGEGFQTQWTIRA
ncbi:MAG TPA: hypothetical protein QF624_01550 [Dehalococcoidia bacterium]|nr:hypothetical protein [Dehalococcoidia bacterium]